MLQFRTIKRPQVFLQILGAAFSGAIATLAFAPFGIWPAMVLSLISFFLLIDARSAKQAALIGLSWGLGHFATGVGWVYVVIDKFGGMPTAIGLCLIFLLVLYLSFYPALFAYLLRRASLSKAQTYLLLAPSLWLVIDWLRGWFLTGFPWLWSGYSQIDGPLASLAPLFGVQGITLGLVLSAAAFVVAYLNRAFSALLIPLVIFTASWTAKQIHWVHQTDDEVKVAMVQGNVPQELKWLPEYRWPTLLSYQDLTRAHWDAELIIWPEAAIPAFERELPFFFERIDKAAIERDVAVITGVLDQDTEGRYFNNLISLGRNGTEGYSYPAPQRYSKHHLLIFGEFVPFEALLRPLAPLFNLPMSSFSKGERVQPNLQAKDYLLAPAICYEIAFNEQVRESLTPDSDFILTISNDTWFGRSIGPHQHLEIARMRALENGKPVLRATNTGLTAAIDYQGKIIEQIAQFETQVLRAKVPTTRGQTPYTRFGDKPLYVWIFFSLMALALVKVAEKRKKAHLPHSN